MTEVATSSDPLPPLYFTLGIDNIKEEFVIIGVAKTKEKANKSKKRSKCLYKIVYELNEGPEVLHSWITSCGITSNEATNIVQEFGVTLLKMMVGD